MTAVFLYDNTEGRKGGEMKRLVAFLLAIGLMAQAGCVVSQGKYTEAVKKNKDLEQRVAALSGDKENLKKEYSKLLEEKLTLKNDYDTAVGEKAALKAEYSKLLEDKVTVSAKYEKLLSEKNNLEKKVKELETKIAGGG